MLYRTESGENICPSQPPVFRQGAPENLGGNPQLVERTFYEYGKLNKPIRETTYNAAGDVVQQNSYAYNRRGENIRYTIRQQNNRISGSSSAAVNTIDFYMTGRKKGGVSETLRYEDNKPVQREINYVDRRGRSRKSELYILESDAAKKVVKQTIGFRTRHVYDGNKELLSWTLYDPSGKLKTQLYILSENDNELMRIEYDHRDQPQMTNKTNIGKITHYRFENINSEQVSRLKYILKFDERVENPKWIPTSFEIRSYKFDARHNIIEYIFQERKESSAEIKDGSTYQIEISYYK